MTKTFLKFRSRITVIICFVIFSWMGLCVRLFQIQIINGQMYTQALVEQAQKKEDLPPNRGNILDRHNRLLSRNIIHYTLSANPSKVLDIQELAEAIHVRTGEPVEKYIDKLNIKGNFTYLERNMQRETLGTLLNMSFDGLFIKRHYKRRYPHGSIAAQVLGYTNIDDEGISGIEKDFNTYLSGKPGWIIKSKGWSGKIQKRSGLPFRAPIDGCSVQLTLDLQYQSILQDELHKRQKEADATTATGIIINPQTGEILAMASTPGFDNNNFSKYSLETHRCRAITDQFEPGSTFKIVSAVAVLSEKKVTLTEEFNCENGEFNYFDITVRDHEEYGQLTFPQIIKHSSNIGIIKIAERLGRSTLYRYARDFGFGSATQISLKGGTSGTLRPLKKWSQVSLGQIAMGHEVAVTALQLAVAYSAVANGGYLVTPRIIHQIVNSKMKVIHKNELSIVRQIADTRIMKQTKDMLRKVVSDGTGIKADIPGWGVAGKTGTAQKYINGHYSNDKFISNFVGFFPVNDPQLLAVIVLDEPKAPFHWGGQGAAVAFRRIMERIINMDDSIIPPKKKKRSDFIKDDIILVENEKSYVIPASIREPRFLSTIGTHAKRNYVHVPDVRSTSLRKAMTKLHQAGLKIKVEGSGKVLWQSPRPGTIANPGDICIVHLQ